jgi:hypothetical protein
MFKKKMTILVLGVAMGSQAFAVDPPHILEGRFGPGGFGGMITAYWGDHTPGPQPTVPPVKLLTLASGSQFGPITLPEPTQPIARILLASGLNPTYPKPYPFQDDLPMILASVSDMDAQLKGFPESIEITMRDLGEIIETLYGLDLLRQESPDSSGADPEVVAIMAVVIMTAGNNGYIGDETVEEILQMMASWSK